MVLNAVTLVSLSAAYISVSTMYHPNSTETLSGFSMSGWFQAFANTDGYIIAKTNSDGSRHFYSLRLITNSLQAQIVFGYSVTGSNVSKIYRTSRLLWTSLEQMYTRNFSFFLAILFTSVSMLRVGTIWICTLWLIVYSVSMLQVGLSESVRCGWLFTVFRGGEATYNAILN